MLDSTRPFLISPPFGAYLGHPRAYSVLGSYTRLPRPGRTLQVLRSVRPLGREPDGEPKGWLNKVGLRNPGWDVWPKSHTNYIRQAMGIGPEPEFGKSYSDGGIISLAPLEATDWHAIERWLDERFQRPIVELNVSCPNVDEHPKLPPNHLIQRLQGGGATIIWKLPPVPSSVDAALRLAGLGARYIHLSNTLPTPVGGLSGKALREVNLPLVDEIANKLERAGYKDFRDFTGAEEGKRGHPTGWNEGRSGGVTVIAGGGIYSSDHLRRYRDAGATRFSLATAFFNPIRGYRIIREG